MIDEEKAGILLGTFAAQKAPPWRPIKSRELSRLLGVSLQSLANWRVRDTGPEPEPYKRGQGNRMMYRTDVVMSWLSGLCGAPREPWEFSRDWLIAQGLHNLERNPVQVANLIQLMDRGRYFR